MRSFFLALIGCGGLLISAALSPSGCGDVEAAFDCQSVCERYQQCYEPNYDVGKCRDNCRTRAKDDPSVRSAAGQCEACIGDKSCISATFACAGSCSQIVP